MVSDIKNAENYSLSASSWKYLADVRSLSNYYPYGSLIRAGSWSGGGYNYGYNGMLKEGIGKDIYNTHFRNLSVSDVIDNYVFYDNQGELEKIGELGKEINIDRILPQIKGKSAKEAKKLDIFGWKEKVETNGEWDYKNSYKEVNDKDNTIFGLAWKEKDKGLNTKFSYSGMYSKMDVADFGNYMAGFTGKYIYGGIGLPNTVLLTGAGVYQVYTDFDQGRYFKAYLQATVGIIFLFDEPDDAYWNFNGMQDAKRRQFYNYFNRNE